jgi:DUF917 family protein
MDNSSKLGLEYLAEGSCFFASGGGGPKQGALSLINNYNGNPVNVTQLSTAIEDEEGLSVVLAYMGAPSGLNSIKEPVALQSAFNRIQEYCNKNPHNGKTKIKYLVPVENGVFGMVAPCILVTKNAQLSVLDADGAGRAVPKLTMITMYENDINPNPVVLSSSPSPSQETVETILLEVSDNERAEEIIESIARPTIALKDFNQIAGLAIWLMDNKELEKANLVPNTLGLSVTVGETLKNLNDSSPIDKLFPVLKNHNYTPTLIGKGKYFKHNLSTRDGFDFGTIIFKNDTTTYTISYQNENIIAWSSDEEKPAAIGPDLICYVTEKGLTFSNDDLMYYAKELKEQEVYIIRVKAPEQLRGARILASFNETLNNMGYYGSNPPV